MGMSTVSVGLCGATCSGKTSVAYLLQKKFPHSIVVRQDTYFLNETQLQKRKGVYHWDDPESLDQEKLLCAVQEACHHPHLLCQECSSCDATDKTCTHIIIVEGTMILALDKLRCLDATFFITLDEATCRQRRAQRKYDGAPDPPEYFDVYLWPSYLQLYNSTHVQQNAVILDGHLSLHELAAQVIAHV